jgi:deleted-in-malignant-brain-tumors protein 1
MEEIRKILLLCLLVSATLLQTVTSDNDLNLPIYSNAELKRQQELKSRHVSIDHRGKTKSGGLRADDCTDNTLIDFATRLIGCDGRLSPQAGILQIYYKNNWGTVCDDYFNLLDAQVACLQLGFKNGSGLFYMTPGHFNKEPYNPTTKTVLDDVQCDGTEAFLDACDHAVWTEHNCEPREDINIACAADGPDGKYGYTTRLVNDNDNDTDVGRLEIHHNGIWGTVCDDQFDNIEAGVACRTLGYATGIQIFEKDVYGRGEGKIWLDEMLCTDADYNIGNCAHDPWGLHDCNHEEDVMIRCGQCFDVLCLNGGRCVDELTKDCQCLAGYEGQFCETVVDLCASEPCFNGGTCERLEDCAKGGGSTCERSGSRLPDGYQCDCTPDYTGDHCEDLVTTSTTPSTTTSTTTTPSTTTIFVDNCLIYPCEPGSTCINNPPSFICICPPYKTGDRCQFDIELTSDPAP